MEYGEEEESKGRAHCEVREEEEEEYIVMLFSKESAFERGEGEVFTKDWTTYERTDAVQWIIKTGEFFGFSVQTAYLAALYLDRFFSKRTIDARQSWAIRLASLACLSLAAKMEECRVPALTEYSGEEWEFDGGAIQRMELLVLNTLEWRMGSITPFLFLDYFASKFGLRFGDKGLLLEAEELIVSAIEEMNLVDHPPSALALAAVFAAAGQPLTRSLLESRLGVCPFRSFQTDRALDCYNLMTTMTQDSCKSRQNQPLPFSSNVIGSAARNKKRRISLSLYADTCPTNNSNFH
ncbi:cyclin-D5-1-like [Wolffia australiana]